MVKKGTISRETAKDGKGCVIIVTGPPGAGKTTQAELLKEHFNGTSRLLKVGQMLREVAEKNLNSSQRIKSDLRHNSPVSSKLVNRHLSKTTQNLGDGLLILDGYPLDHEQVNYLIKNWREEHGPRRIIVIELAPGQQFCQELLKKKGELDSFPRRWERHKKVTVPALQNLKGRAVFAYSTVTPGDLEETAREVLDKVSTFMAIAT